MFQYTLVPDSMCITPSEMKKVPNSGGATSSGRRMAMVILSVLISSVVLKAQVTGSLCNQTIFEKFLNWLRYSRVGRN